MFDPHHNPGEQCSSESYYAAVCMHPVTLDGIAQTSPLSQTFMVFSGETMRNNVKQNIALKGWGVNNTPFGN